MEHQGNTSSWQDFKRFYAFFKPYRFRAIAGMFLTMALGSFDAIIAWLLRPFMDNVIVGGGPASSLTDEVGDFVVGGAFFPLLILFFVIVQSLFNFGSNYLMTWVGQHAGNDVKLALFDKLNNANAAFFDKTTTGEIIVRYNADADAATDKLLSDFRQFATRIISSIALICVLIYNSWILAVVAVGILAMTALPVSRVRKKMKMFIKDSLDNDVQIKGDLSEAYSGNRVIASYNLQGYVHERMRANLNDFFRLKIKLVQRANWLTMVMHLATGIGIAATVWLQAYLIRTGRMTPGNFVSFMTALLMLYTPLKRLGTNISTMQAATMAIRRIMTLLDLEPTVATKPGAQPFPGLKDAIEYKDVSFHYNPGHDVLNHVNLQIKAGQSVAFVGNSGGGKSTLVTLLPRFYDVTGGGITIDGVDLRDMDLQSLRENMAIVFQDSFLFVGSIRENIMLGRRDASEDDLHAALKAACLQEFVAGLPDGLDTKLGERGLTLSGGQRQRMAIARAFIKNAPIVILDEATSALDTKSETVVQEAIDNLALNRTVLIVAHRLSTIINADRIVVIRDGEIVESGKHADLMKIKGGFYASLYAMQGKEEEEAHENIPGE